MSCYVIVDWIVTLAPLSTNILIGLYSFEYYTVWVCVHICMCVCLWNKLTVLIHNLVYRVSIYVYVLNSLEVHASLTTNNTVKS